MSNSTASKLDNLIGLSSAKLFVRRLAQDDHGIHAVLLYGAKGAGKTELARLITELWLCNEPTVEGADGTCRACAAFGRGNSADVLAISPQGPSSIIKIEAICKDNPVKDDPTPMLTFFRTPPMYSRHKVAIIFDAHRMNSTSANALLKTLEEPHPHAKMILTTDTVGSIMPTILSRCLAVACESPSHDALIEAFPTATQDEIRLAEGTPGRLLTIAGKRDAYARLLQFARELAKRQPGEALVAAERFHSIADAFQAAGNTNVRSAHAEALDALATFFAREPGTPPEWAHLISESHRRIIGNGGAGLVFDALFAAMLVRGR